MKSWRGVLVAKIVLLAALIVALFGRPPEAATQEEVGAAAQKTVPVYTLQPSSPPGTYWSVQHLVAGDNYPPLPINPFPEIWVETLDATNRVFLLHDELVDCIGLEAQVRDDALVESVMARAFGLEEMEGGSYGLEGFSFSSDDLYLKIASVTNSAAGRTAAVVIHPPEGETNAVFDLFVTTNLSARVPGLNGTNWQWVLRGEPGQTNLVVTEMTAEQCYFL